MIELTRQQLRIIMQMFPAEAIATILRQAVLVYQENARLYTSVTEWKIVKAEEDTSGRGIHFQIRRMIDGATDGIYYNRDADESLWYRIKKPCLI